jgi:ABC-type amino acid transport substrate-binding protein
VILWHPKFRFFTTFLISNAVSGCGELQKFFATCLVLAGIFGTLPSAYSAAITSLDLTEAEKAFIQKHPNIKIGIDSGYAPYSFLDDKQNFVGVAPDFLKKIGSMTGLNFDPVPGLTWREIVKQGKDKSLDVIATLVRTPERDRFFSFTQIYLPTPLVIMTRKGDLGILGASDLGGKTVALVKQYSSSQRVMREHPNIIPLFTETPLAGLQAVATGRADAYIGVLGINIHLVREYGLANLGIAASYDLVSNGQRFGVRRDWPELGSILDKAIDAIGPAGRAQLVEKWVPVLISENSGLSKHLFKLTDDERAWLEKHGAIRIGAMNAWPPIAHVDETGKHEGIDIGFVNAINRRLNGVLEIVPGSWEGIYDAVKNQKLDALTSITPRANREEFFNFTEPYANIPHVIFARKGEEYFASLSDLSGHVVAVEDGFFIADVLREKYPKIKLSLHKSTGDALEAVSKGGAAAYVGNRAVALYIIRNELIPNLVRHAKITETSSINAIGVRKDLPILRDILQKALSNVSVAERRLILQEWVSVNSRRGEPFVLSKEEKDWLRLHPVIRVASDRAWSPVEFVGRNGVFEGVAVDYLSKISDLLGVRFEHDLKSSWREVTDKLKKRELDMFSAAAATEDRLEYATFTAPYLNLPAVIFTRSDYPFAGDLSGLAGKKVAVVSGYAIAEFIKKGDWGMELVPVDDVRQGLEMILEKKADAYVGSILVTGHYIRLAGFTNLVVSGRTPYSVNVAMAARNDWPTFARILSKAVSHVAENERHNIIGKWVGLTIKTPVDYRFLWLVTSAVGVILAFLVVWVWALRRKSVQQAFEISANNVALRAEVAEREFAEREALRANKVKDTFFSNVSHEFRTPLNAILGFAELIKEQLGELKGAQKQREYINYICESGSSLLSLIENVVDIATIGDGARALNKSELDIGQILKDCVEKFARQAEENGIEVHVDVPDSSLVVNADERCVQKFLNSVLSNAFKFTQKGGCCLDKRLAIRPSCKNRTKRHRSGYSRG